MLRNGLFRWLVKGVAAVAMVGILAVATLFLLLWREHNTGITLPKPTGSFAVGRATYTWVSDGRSEEVTAFPGAKREVIVWIWYPAATTTSAPPAEYLPAAWQSAITQHSGALMSKFLTRDLSLVRTHSTAEPPVSPTQSAYPVVILRAGGGALTTDYTTLAEDLASHGYFVVGFDAPYRSFVVVLPDGRVIARPPEYNPENLPAPQAELLINRLLLMWIDDTKFVVAQLQKLNAADPSGRFTGHLDMQRLGMFGHSFGGAQALQFCHDDPECAAGIDIDGAPYGSVVQEGLKQPFLFILSDHSRELSDPAARKIGADLQSIYERLPNGRLFVSIRGANHFSFSDQMLLKSPVLITLLRAAGVARLEGRRGLAISAEYVHSFFDVYLKGDSPNKLTSISKKYPEVEIAQGVRQGHSD